MLTLAELENLARVPEDAVPALAALAHEVRLAYCGPTVEVEGILSAKTSGCPEDCSFCSQSSRYASPVLPTAILKPDEILAAARETAAFGAAEFCIVAAVRGPTEELIDRTLEQPSSSGGRPASTSPPASASSRAQAERLAAGGVHRYNHNLERPARSSARSSPPTRRSATRPAGSCGRSGWSSAAARSWEWARPTRSASS